MRSDSLERRGGSNVDASIETDKGVERVRRPNQRDRSTSGSFALVHRSQNGHDERNDADVHARVSGDSKLSTSRQSGVKPLLQICKYFFVHSFTTRHGYLRPSSTKVRRKVCYVRARALLLTRRSVSLALETKMRRAHDEARNGQRERRHPRIRCNQ